VAAAYPVDFQKADFDREIEPVGANLNDEVTLVGYGVDSRRMIPGHPLWITLYFRAYPRARDEYEFYVQVLDREGNPIAKVHRWLFDGMCRTQLWRRGELVPVRLMLQIPPDAKVGAYHIIAGLFRVLENNSLDVLDQSGSKIDDHVTLAGFKVPPPSEEPWWSTPPHIIVFGGKIALAGMGVDTTRDALEFRANWQPVNVIDRAHTLFIHILSPDGKIAAQLDTQPLGGSYPTDVWDGGEIVQDQYRVPLPENLPPGRYTVTIGWYTLPEGTRLGAQLDGEHVPNDEVEIYSFTLP
jgi:hypothetical protein